MRSAESALREVDARLELPARRRVALLRELRSDFEDLVAALEAEGAAPDVARQRALTLLVPTAAETGALVELHRPPYARLAGRLPRRYARTIELAGVGGMALLAAFAPVYVLIGIPGPGDWTGLVLRLVAGIVVAHLAWHAFRLLVRQDADAAGLARAGRIQAGLLGLTFAVGALATATEAYRAAGKLAAGNDLVMSLASCAETAALALSIGVLGLFGTAALVQAHQSTRCVEEELGRLLVDAPPYAGDQPS